MRRRPRRGLALAGLTVAALLVLARPATAHPLGNFTINLYRGLVLEGGGVRIDYVADLAEIPTFQRIPDIDTDRDGAASPAELDAWAATEARRLLAGVRVSAGGEVLRPVVGPSSARLLPGQAGLQVLRLEAEYTAPLPAEGQLRFVDENFRDRIGWRDVTAVGEGASIAGASVPSSSVSARLTAYPEELLSSPPDVSRATVRFRPGPGTAPAAGEAPDPAGDARPGTEGGLAGLIARPATSFPFILLSLATAVGVGALHALGPGHGKTLMALYLAGSSARSRTVVSVAGAVAAMHTLSVLLVGLLILLAERLFPAERVYPWLGLASGAVVAVLGGALLRARLRRRAPHADEADPDGHVHPHSETSPPVDHRISRPRLAAIAVSGGILPSPSALVVLLAAVSLGRVAFGLGLVVAFGVGLAVALAAVGVLAIRARDLVSGRLSGRLARAIPVGSAAGIMVLGLGLLTRAAVQL